MTKPLDSRGMSMIELMIGVTIFGLAMLPLLWLGTSQTRGAYSIGKHMMAGQIAASFIDKLLSLPYKDGVDKAKELTAKGKRKVLLDPDLEKILTSVGDQSIENDMETSFRNFYYKFDYKENDAEKIFRLDIEVFYRVDENSSKSEQSVQLSVLKFGERNG